MTSSAVCQWSHFVAVDALLVTAHPPRWAALARGTQQGGPAMDANQELAGGERRPKREDFQIFSSAIILDRNSRICFHKCVETGALPKSNRARWRARSVGLTTCSAT
jgi:hypothetical protein